MISIDEFFGKQDISQQQPALNKCTLIRFMFCAGTFFGMSANIIELTPEGKKPNRKNDCTAVMKTAPKIDQLAINILS